MKSKIESVHVWHIEMLDRDQSSDEVIDKNYELKKAEIPLPELNRFLYVTVGAPWTWHMRVSWSFEQWHNYLVGGNIETWVAYAGATPIGYFELDIQPGKDIYFAAFNFLT